MSFIQIVKATHKPSGNVKLYKNETAAKGAISKSTDPKLDNWKLEKEFVWS